MKVEYLDSVEDNRYYEYITEYINCIEYNDEKID